MSKNHETKAEWFEEGLSFSCTQCGNCCTGPPGFVWFNDEEARAMAKERALSEDAFREKYARQFGERWSLQEVRRDGKYDCVFLRRDEHGKALCSVYGSRPTQCRTWPFWPELLESEKAWKKASQRCPGMDGGRFFPSDQIRLIRASNPPD
ncbi:MAG: YkgJ family cysteine cluster protein [Phycisphaeraceae bacterium]